MLAVTSVFSWLVIAVTFVVVEHRLWACGLSRGSQTLEHRVSGCGARDQLPCGMWHLPRPGTIYREKYALFISHLLPTLLGN